MSYITQDDVTRLEDEIVALKATLTLHETQKILEEKQRDARWQVAACQEVLDVAERELVSIEKDIATDLEIARLQEDLGRLQVDYELTCAAHGLRQ